MKKPSFKELVIDIIDFIVTGRKNPPGQEKKKIRIKLNNDDS